MYTVIARVSINLSKRGHAFSGAVCALAALIVWVAPTWGWCADELLANVTEVTDGDTFVVVDKLGRRENVRIAAIDAPEKRHNEVPGQRFAQQSRANLTNLVIGKQIRLVSDGRDDYERIVARAWVEQKDVGLAQVCAGYAWVSERYVAQFALADQRTYRDCQKTAKERKFGLWRDTRPVPPWVWRHAHRVPRINK